MSSLYYSIEDDLKKYPKATQFFIVGGRNTGKTYSTLKYMYENKIPFGFIKRTNDDVKLLCAGNKTQVDLSPFKPINRDIGSNVRACLLEKGIGAFFNCDEENEPIGKAIAHILSLHAVKDIKGFDISEDEFLVFDEFIAMLYQRIDRMEGEQLLDLWKTATRDRELRGLPPTKLICLANATNVNNPIFITLELVDIVAMMDVMGEEYYYNEERGIVIHLLHSSEDFTEAEKNSAIYKSMQGTQWADMAFGNTFSYNDFSCVGKQSLKRFKPYIELTYKRKMFYIYINDNGEYYMCSSRNNRSPFSYNLNRETEQKQFFIDKCVDIRMACINGRMKFETYSMYDLIINYKKVFRI